jgi:hypothetical protein
MQKKKPSFQVIPNYSINGATSWNESKEVPAEQGCVDMAWAISPAAAGLSVRLIAIAKLSRRSRPWPESHNPPPKMVRRNNGVGAILARIRQALFIEHSSEI